MNLLTESVVACMLDLRFDIIVVANSGWLEISDAACKVNLARKMANIPNTLELGHIQCQQKNGRGFAGNAQVAQNNTRQQTLSDEMPACGWRVALMIYVLQDWQTAAAVTYLRNQINRPEDEEDLIGQVETWFLQASLEDICALSPPHQSKN